MRVALISDSPTLPTGFARTTRSLVHALTKSGHEVSCYGMGIFGETFDQSLYPCRIWAAGDDVDEAQERFLHFVRSEKPGVILINYDLMTTLRWLNFFKQAAMDIEIVSYLIVDGLPVYPEIIRAFNQCAAVIAATQCVQTHLAAALSAPVYYLPHLVDCARFRPLKDADAVKRTLFGDAFVVGSIAQNRTRKQLVQTIHAMRLLRDAGRRSVFLLHTDRIKGMRFGGHALRRVVEYFGIADIVHMTESHQRIDAAAEDASGISGHFGASLKIGQLPDLTVAERLNLCDVAVVASSFGGFEYGIVEAQSCGIPVCVTDDSGIMREVAGEACEPLRPSLFEFTEYGAQVWKLSPETIAAAIASLADDPTRRLALQESGVRNAKRYDRAMNETVLTDTLDEILESLPSCRKSRVA